MKRWSDGGGSDEMIEDPEGEWVKAEDAFRTLAADARALEIERDQAYAERRDADLRIARLVSGAQSLRAKLDAACEERAEEGACADAAEKRAAEAEEMEADAMATVKWLGEQVAKVKRERDAAEKRAAQHNQAIEVLLRECQSAEASAEQAEKRAAEAEAELDLASRRYADEYRDHNATRDGRDALRREHDRLADALRAIRDKLPKGWAMWVDAKITRVTADILCIARAATTTPTETCECGVDMDRCDEDGCCLSCGEDLMHDAHGERRDTLAARLYFGTDIPEPKGLTLAEVDEGAERAAHRVAAWPAWKREVATGRTAERPPSDADEAAGRAYARRVGLTSDPSEDGHTIAIHEAVVRAYAAGRSDTPAPLTRAEMDAADRLAECRHGTEGAAADPSICSVCMGEADTPGPICRDCYDAAEKRAAEAEEAEAQEARHCGERIREKARADRLAEALRDADERGAFDCIVTPPCNGCWRCRCKAALTDTPSPKTIHPACPKCGWGNNLDVRKKCRNCGASLADTPAEET